jgi:hypothetical protein
MLDVEISRSAYCLWTLLPSVTVQPRAAQPHYLNRSRYLLRLKSSFSGNSRGLIRLGPISHLVNKFKGNVYAHNGKGI